MKKLIFCLLLPSLVLVGCRSVYYSTMETFGKQKRDLLQTKVQQVRNEQDAAAQQLKDALTQLQELYGTEGTELEKAYKRLQSEYESSVSKAEALRDRIKQMDRVARDLFAEWEKEAASIQTASLRQASEAQLRDTQSRYQTLYTTTTRAEKSMEPVLVKFKDYVLYLKHNLNAQALGTLQGEATRIQTDINRLIADMNASIKQADDFIKATK